MRNASSKAWGRVGRKYRLIGETEDCAEAKVRRMVLSGGTKGRAGAMWCGKGGMCLGPLVDVSRSCLRRGEASAFGVWGQQVDVWGLLCRNSYSSSSRTTSLPLNVLRLKNTAVERCWRRWKGCGRGVGGKEDGNTGRPPWLHNLGAQKRPALEPLDPFRGW